MDLRNRIAVVTGASTGIGRAIAQGLGEAGCRVAICARSADALERAAAEIRRSAAPEVLAVPADVSREDEVARFADRVEAELGPADILVNNAGSGVFGRFLDLDVQDFDRTFAVNVRGVFLCSRAFVPAMVERGDGVIANIASLAGKNFFPHGSVYAASKHALMGLSKCMMLDLRGDGVRVITICPGSVDTAFFDEHPGWSPAVEEGKALRPEDVAELVLTALRLSDRGTVSEVEIRPVNP